MSYPRHTLPGAAPRPTTQWTVRHRHAHKPQQVARPTRAVNIQWLDGSGNVQEAARLAPAIPLVEEMFTAFARGSILPTPQGPVAIEDLMVGDTVETCTGPATLAWIGRMTLLPGGSDERSPSRLFRIAADTFGLGRPMPDLMLGVGGRVLNRSGQAHASHGASALLQSVSTLVDGENVIQLRPVSPVTLFHIGFEDHRTLLANGVEVESMHPGPLSQNRIDPAQLAQLLALLPHVSQFSELGRLAFPREEASASFA
ncbi:Hint domain-containing protein [Oceaniglobus roseus]|uniref:Hint domain-containing protein n=1 Tax=Oceaniglobus roseus TaxID=1737570 RepID=UPI000C7EB290|nr:Hint domain-containing protein [Kandeliimicrobium roseum]